MTENKRKAPLIVGIILIALILSGLIMDFAVVGFGYLLDSSDKEPIRSQDIDLYKNNVYDSFVDSSTYEYVVERCKMYIPEYSQFKYKQYVDGFYIFDGTNTLSRNVISFVLELKFDTVAEYEEFLAFEYARCEYTNEFNISHNGYKCLITTNEKYTYYDIYRERYRRFGMLCESKETLTVRYIYFSDTATLNGNPLEIVFRDTNCDW